MYGIADLGPLTGTMQYVQLRSDATLEVFFCNLHSSWHEDTNEKNSRRLWQYFPKKIASPRLRCRAFASMMAASDGIPRKTLGW